MGRRLVERNLRPFCPASIPHHRRARLALSRKCADWTVEEWKDVLFSHESRIALRGPDGRQHVYMRQNENFASSAISETVDYQGGTIMVREDIADSVTVQKYVQNVLQNHVIPFAPFLGHNFRFMHDNAR